MVFQHNARRMVLTWACFPSIMHVKEMWYEEQWLTAVCPLVFQCHSHDGTWWEIQISCRSDAMQRTYILCCSPQCYQHHLNIKQISTRFAWRGNPIVCRKLHDRLGNKEGYNLWFLSLLFNWWRNNNRVKPFNKNIKNTKDPYKGRQIPSIKLQTI